MATNGPRSARRLPDAMRRRLEVATAMAWEALVDAHTTHALDFLALLEGRMQMQEALTRYLREMGIIEPMATAVRTKVLVALEDAETAGARVQLHEAEAEAEAAASPDDVVVTEEEEDEDEDEGWRRFTPGALVSGVRERQRSRDATDRLILLSTARAEEAVIATHVDNAITFVALLDSAVGLDRAVQEYIRLIGLAGGRAQAVFQRTMARLAEVHLPRMRRGTAGLQHPLA
jgi:hypothetical protein